MNVSRWMVVFLLGIGAVALVLGWRMVACTPRGVQKIRLKPHAGEGVAVDGPRRHYGTYTFGDRPPNTLMIEGPLAEFDVSAAGESLFSPVHVASGASQEEITRAVFEFMGDHFLTWSSAPGMNVTALLYGTGFGLCGEESSVMCSLWQRFGVDCQIVSWPRHVAAEACFDGAWHFFDAQHRIDFSKENGRPTGYEDVMRDVASMPIGLDVAGYDPQYLTRVFFEAAPRISTVPDKPTPPRFDLSPSQKMVIRPRTSISESVLPVADEPATRHRTDLLPGYELTVIQAPVKDGTPVWFYTGLPVIAVDLAPSAMCSVKTAGDDGFHNIDVASFGETIVGDAQGFWLQPESGCGAKITYALADWIGDRICNRRPGETLTFSAATPTVLEMWTDQAVGVPRIARIFVTEPLILGQVCRLHVQIAWENLPPGETRAYRLVLEELSSNLNLEVWRQLGDRVWTYDPRVMKRPGSATMVFDWEVTQDGSPYRPPEVRTVLARIVGPGVLAGENWQKVEFIAVDPS